MQNFTENCLCRAVTYKSNTSALRTFNCHCEDCRKCGCQMFSFNEGTPRLNRVHAGTVNELEVVKPQWDVGVSNNILCIKMDKTLDQFQRNFT